MTNWEVYFVIVLYLEIFTIFLMILVVVLMYYSKLGTARIEYWLFIALLSIELAYPQLIAPILE